MGKSAKRGTAGILATIIMFTMLFTIGTSYFLFVNGLNSSYAKGLVLAQNNRAGAAVEKLLISTILVSNGDLGFYANNTSGESVNMTAVYVLSLTGLLQKCDGVGLAPAAGCSNTTPPLWAIVNVGKGSATFDTGYLYSVGSGDTVTVLTARGNTYSATYPPSASSNSVSANTAQTLTLNPSTFKWTTIQASPAALKQSKYSSNCNAAACALGYTSAVTGGNTLVYGAGWNGQSPPSTPTDTLGDTFSLAASNSLSTTPSSTLVQNRYTSNCNSANCGLAYSSNIASGNTLVFGLGWYGQNPPSAPTDTRGDSFVLGASQSVTYNPPSPSLVQKGYTSNCNSSSCGLAFPSSVTAGNTLVYGLGWYAGLQYYVPVTLTNNAGSGSLALDGSAGAGTETASISASLTTTSANDVIILSAGTSSSSTTVSTVSDAGGHTWTHRQTMTGSPSVSEEEWYTTANAALSADSITVTWSAAGDNVFTAFGISGANTASPFDSNGALPATATGSGTAPTVSVSTSNANDYVFGLLANEHTSFAICHSETAGSGFTLTLAETALGAATCMNSNEEYQIVSTTQTGVAVPFTTDPNGTNQWAEIGDAVKAGNGAPTPTIFQEMVTWNPSTYSAYEAADLGNVRFCADSACATTLYGWLESCTSSCSPSATSASAWVKLTSSIAAGGQLTIYMVFYGTPVKFDANYWGEAPSLSSPYGSYDNGANVFLAYFDGNTALGNFNAPAGITISKSTGVTYGAGTINAITISGYGSSAWYGMAFSTSIPNQAIIAESNFQNNHNPSDMGAVGILNSATDSSATNAIGVDMGYASSFFSNNYLLSGTQTPDLNQQGTANTNWNYGTLTFTGSGSSSWSGFISPQLYSSAGGYSGTTSNNPLGSSALYLGLLGSTISGYVWNEYVNFERARAYPPSNVMPSTSFGSVTSGNIPPAAPTDTLGDTYALAVSMTVASGTTTYFSYIWYGTAGSSAADTVTATFASSVTGSVSIYELAGYTTTGAQSSTGSSSAGSVSLSVSSFTPASNSIVIGNAETSSSTSTYTAGSGFTLAGTCNSVYGCGESKTGVGTATTVPFTLGTSAPWAESAISFAPATAATYYSYIWYATAASSGADTISASFGSAVTGSVSIYELNSVTTVGLLSSTGSSSSAGSSASVSSITPGASSVVIGNTEAGSNTFTAGAGYTLNAACGSVYGCSEYQTGLGSATTVPMTLTPGQPWVETALAFAPVLLTYYSYIWYATAVASGADTITATFGSTVAGSVSIYELNGYLTTGITSSTGSSAAGSTTASVASFTPGKSSIVIGNTETSSTSFTAGGSFTLVATCNSVYGCSEYQTGVSTATTAPSTLNPSAPWVEVAVAFGGAPALQNGELVGGFPSSAIPFNVPLSWRVQFTNQDSQGRSVTLWPKSLAAIQSIIQESAEITPFFIVDGISSDGTTLIGYNTTHNYVTIPYKSTVTVYFGSVTPRGTGTDQVDTNNEIAPFIGFFALEGIYSDNTLFGLTVPYPAGMVTSSNAKSTPTAAAAGATVTISCTNPCNFIANRIGLVGWMDSAGKITTVKTFTMDSSGNIPSGVTFQVPTATAGFYTLVISDYVNTAYIAFQHT